MGEARRSISDYLIPMNNENNQQIVTPAQKRQRTDNLDVPTITLQSPGSDAMSSESTETVIPVRGYIQTDLTGNRDAVRHDRLLDKIDRYKSHMVFIQKCITNKIIPYSYKVTVEPSIGNHDDEFLNGYYDLLDSSSKKLMEYSARLLHKNTR